MSSPICPVKKRHCTVYLMPLWPLRMSGIARCSLTAMQKDVTIQRRNYCKLWLIKSSLLSLQYTSCILIQALEQHPRTKSCATSKFM